MLVSFSVANFRSFSSEQTFSLIASNRLGADHKDHLAAIPGSSNFALRAAIIYGANGAGKSNLFKALKYLKDFATRPQEKESGTNRQQFRLPEESGLTSDFDICFIADNKLYRYGLKVDDLCVREEWLLKIRKDRESILFERNTDISGQVNVKLKGIKQKKVIALATVGGPQNQSFIATIAANLKSEDYGQDIDTVLNWFRCLVLISPGASHNDLARSLSQSDSLLNFAGNFLEESSTGVNSLTVTKKVLSEEDVNSILPRPVIDSLVTHLNDAENASRFAVNSRDGTVIIVRKPTENVGGKEYEQLSLKANHLIGNNESVSFDLSQESDGTRRLINLIPALHSLQKNSLVYFIDEIDRSMHPILVRAFVESFLKSCCHGGSQIMMTTHESSLLDLDLVRRDEVWFVEKDLRNSSHLYSLMDFKVRSDLEIRRHYLQGRFGAIPFVGGIDRLVENDVDSSDEAHLISESI